jgi:putative SOS response-associated peptidase YedK
MQWGLIPSWSKDPQQSKPMINARIEGILGKPTFRGHVRKHRCLFPADEFYEWKKEKGGKVPYLIRRKDGQLFAFAGIFDVWHGEGGEVLETYAILTTQPNSRLEQIHKRMPVILDKSREQDWLGTDAAKMDQLLQALEEPIPPDVLEAFPVSKQVHSPRLDSPNLIKRLS